MSIVLLAVGVNWLIGLGRVFDAFQLLVIYMNEAFYGAVAVFMFLLWVIVVFGIDRMTSYRFTPGTMVQVNIFGRRIGVGLDSRNIHVQQLEGDFFRHDILGLPSWDWAPATSSAVRPPPGPSRSCSKT
jgi:hypothetical protein